jgi:hypothetical protein
VDCREEIQPQEQEEDQQIHPLGQYIWDPTPKSSLQIGLGVHPGVEIIIEHKQGCSHQKEKYNRKLLQKT